MVWLSQGNPVQESQDKGQKEAKAALWQLWWLYALWYHSESSCCRYTTTHRGSLWSLLFSPFSSVSSGFKNYIVGIKLFSLLSVISPSMMKSEKVNSNESLQELLASDSEGSCMGVGSPRDMQSPVFHDKTEVNCWQGLYALYADKGQCLWWMMRDSSRKKQEDTA